MRSERARFLDRRERRANDESSPFSALGENGRGFDATTASPSHLGHPLFRGDSLPKSTLVKDLDTLYNTCVENRPPEIDLNEVVVKYRPVVSFKVKKSLGARTPDWEDVVNEVITQVIEKVKKGEFRGDSSIGTFIYTITSRRIIDHIRQKTKVLRSIPEPVPLPDPCDDAESRERSKILAQAVQQLKPKFKEVLNLYYYQELTRDEVAERLGISPRRVSERIHYAQKLLRKMIKT